MARRLSLVDLNTDNNERRDPAARHPEIAAGLKDILLGELNSPRHDLWLDNSL